MQSPPNLSELLECAKAQHERMLASARYTHLPQLNVPWAELPREHRLIMAGAVGGIITAIDLAGFDVVRGELVRRG